MNNRVRLVDIASKVGVSANTVSLALSGSTRISSETRSKIKRIAAELGYVPNGLARSLVKQESRYVGVILRTLKNPLLIEIAREIERHLKAMDYFMVLMSAEGSPAEEIRALRIQQVVGILVYPDFSELNIRQLKDLRATGFPLVLMSSDGLISGLDVVFVDRTIGAYKATSHLVSLGHRHIGYLAGDACKTAGYRMALEEHGIPFDDRNIIKTDDGITYRTGYESAKALLEKNNKLTAIFASTDTYALGAMRYFADRGISVPDDIAIVGYDDIEESRYAPVRLTTMSYDVNKEVELAIDLMLKRASATEAVPQPEIIRLEPELIIRDSCGAKKQEASR